MHRRMFLLGLLAPLAAPARAQDGGAYYLEQVRRNQQFGTVGQPPAAQPPLNVRGPGGFDHDATRLRQEGVLGPRVPTRPTRSRPILTPEQRIATPQAPIPPITTSSGRRYVRGRPVPVRRTRRVRRTTSAD